MAPNASRFFVSNYIVCNNHALPTIFSSSAVHISFISRNHRRTHGAMRSRSALRLAFYPASWWPPLPSGSLDAALDRCGTHSRKLAGPDGSWLSRVPAPVPLRLADSA